MKFTISRDVNGLKVVKVSGEGFKTFSIQTNQNLPNTHQGNIPDIPEIIKWVKTFDTLYQKKALKSL